ncbi:dihydrodipicolinate synthase family protein [Flindersiella endophytica]
MTELRPEAEAGIPSGVIPPLCTPLTPQRDIDVASLERLCQHLLDAGATGLFVGGSTGEAAYLSDELRVRVLEIVVRYAAGQVPVFAGVIDMTTPRVVAHARAAEKQGADALVATAPFYAPTHPAEIGVHFRTIRATVDLPLLAYDIPSAVHTKVPAALVAELATAGVLQGLKDSSGDLDGMRTVLQLLDPDVRAAGFKVFTGSEVMADVGLALGADGIVPGVGNVDPEGFVRLYEAATSGDWAAAAREQERLRRLFKLITVGDSTRMGRYSSAIGAFKAGLLHRGVIAHGTTSLPMIPLSESETAAVRPYLVEAGLVS